MQALLGSLFEGLFKYRPLVFQKGNFTFGSAWSGWLIFGVALAVAIPVIWAYTRARGRKRRTTQAKNNQAVLANNRALYLY